MGGETAIECVRRAGPGAGQTEIATDPPRAQIQEAGRADIGKEADPGLRHRQHRALGRDPKSAVDRDPGAAPHRDAVDDRDIRLRVAVNMADQLIFLAEEHGGQRAVAGEAAPGLVDRADIAAGAEGALAGAADQDGVDVRIIGPGAQHRVETAIHRQGEGVSAPAAGSA